MATCALNIVALMLYYPYEFQERFRPSNHIDFLRHHADGFISVGYIYVIGSCIVISAVL